MFSFSEVVFYIRRKLRSNEPKSVVMTLRLLEAMTNNCGAPWHEAINDEKFMKDLGGVARKFVAKSGADNKEVAEVCLDLIQAWGEAFLAKKKLFPNIVETYFELRKEGLPFKVANQFDPNRVPIFNKPLGQEEYLDPQTDAMLAAAIQQSLEVEEQQRQRSVSRSSRAAPPVQAPPVAVNPYPSSSPSTVNVSPRELLESLKVTLPLLKDMIMSARSDRELQENEFANDIIQQLQASLGGMNSAIENSMDDPEVSGEDNADDGAFTNGVDIILRH